MLSPHLVVYIRINNRVYTYYRDQLIQKLRSSRYVIDSHVYYAFPQVAENGDELDAFLAIEPATFDLLQCPYIEAYELFVPADALFHDHDDFTYNVASVVVYTNEPAPHDLEDYINTVIAPLMATAIHANLIQMFRLSYFMQGRITNARRILNVLTHVASSIEEHLYPSHEVKLDPEELTIYEAPLDIVWEHTMNMSREDRRYVLNQTGAWTVQIIMFWIGLIQQRVPSSSSSSSSGGKSSCIIA